MKNISNFKNFSVYPLPQLDLLLSRISLLKVKQGLKKTRITKLGTFILKLGEKSKPIIEKIAILQGLKPEKF